MASKGIINSIIVLRIFTLLLLAASIALIVTNNFKGDDGDKTKFSHLKAYRYVLAAGAGGALYTLIQLPFALYYAVKEKRMIRGSFLPNFDFYGDKIISFLLATGVGVGFGVSLELKNDPPNGSHTNKFLDRGIISTALLLGGFTTMALLSILTSINRKNRRFL